MDRLENTILIVDIETTGFLEQGGKILEIGIVFLNLDTGKTRPAYHSLIKEEGLDINHTKGNYGWIFSNSDLKYEDVIVSPTLESQRTKIQNLFYRYYATAYNKEFDFNFLKDRGFKIRELPCIMLTAAPIVGIPSSQVNYEYKWPSVEETWFYLFNEKHYIESHRGLQDAEDEARIAYELYKRNVFELRSSMKTHNYLGDVSMCKIEYVDFWDRGAHILDIKNRRSITEYYNRLGQLTHLNNKPNSSYTPNIEFKYNKFGKVLEEVRFKDDRKFIKRVVHIYDIFNNLLRYEYFDQQNQLVNTWNKYEYDYDNRGNIIKSIEIESQPGTDKITHFNYDHSNRLNETESEEYFNCIKELFKYDDNNNLIAKYTYNVYTPDENKSLMGIIFYNFNNDNTIIEKTRLDSNKKIENKELFTYDDYGNLTCEILLDSNLEVTKRKEYFYSNFDQFGNWREKITYENNSKIRREIREFEYFQ